MSKMIFCLYLMLCAVGFIHMSSVLLGNVKKFVLDYHNKLRRLAGAANMMKLSWNNQLALETAAWVRRCNFEHQNEGRGENLASDSRSGKLEVILKNAIDGWAKEKDSLHYTQLLWSKTTEVGCAVERCPYLSSDRIYFLNHLYFACFYNPRGNIGKNIYTPGRPCSKCPKGTSCENALCVAGYSHYTDSYNTDKCEN